METHDYIIQMEAPYKAKDELINFIRMMGGYAIADELMPFIYAIGIQDNPRLTQYLRDLAKDYSIPEPVLNEYTHRGGSPSARVLSLRVKAFGLLPKEKLHPVRMEKPDKEDKKFKPPKVEFR